MERGDDMLGSDDPFERALRQAFSSGIAEPSYVADTADPETVPIDLVGRTIARAGNLSSELLAKKLVQAGAAAGWTTDELVTAAVGQEGEARDFLRGWRGLRRLEPRSLARLIWRSELDQPHWQTLLLQAVASSFVTSATEEGQVWGRTSGLSGAERGEALAGRGERDPEQVARAAAIFVEEVIDEWTSLTTGETTIDEDME
jgi:hypothetical protein